MSAAAILALVLGLLGAGGVGGVIVAMIQARSKNKGDLLTALSGRLAQVEKELGDLRARSVVQENRYSALWAYCRRLIDYAYQHRKPDSPELPDMPDDLK